MISGAVAEVFESDTTGAASIGHGYTYSGHPVGAAAALACLAETEKLNVAANAAKMGNLLFAGLNALKAAFPVIGDVRGGAGLMCAIEMVSDTATKSAPSKETVEKIQKVAYENGAMVRVSGPNIILSPPLILTEADVNTILNALRAGFNAL